MSDKGVGEVEQTVRLLSLHSWTARVTVALLCSLWLDISYSLLLVVIREDKYAHLGLTLARQMSD